MALSCRAMCSDPPGSMRPSRALWRSSMAVRAAGTLGLAEARYGGLAQDELPELIGIPSPGAEHEVIGVRAPDKVVQREFRGEPHGPGALLGHAADRDRGHAA